RRCLASAGDLSRGPVACCNHREQIQFNGRPQRFGALIGIDRIKKQRGRWTLVGHGGSCLLIDSITQRLLVDYRFTGGSGMTSSLASRGCTIVASTRVLPLALG